MSRRDRDPDFEGYEDFSVGGPQTKVDLQRECVERKAALADELAAAVQTHDFGYGQPFGAERAKDWWAIVAIARRIQAVG